MIASRWPLGACLPVVAVSALAAACSFYSDCPCANQPAAGGKTGTGGTTAVGGSAGTTGGNGANGGLDMGGAAGAHDDIPVVPGAWKNVTGKLGGRNIACGGLTMLSVKPDEDLVIAGLSEVGLWGTRDGGMTWAALGTGHDSTTLPNRPSSITYDPDTTGRFWESGIYVRGGVYRTDDDGDTFQPLGDIWHTEYISVDFGDSKRRTLLAGGHEQPQVLNRSTDGGATWEALGEKLPVSCSWSTFPLLIDASTYLMGCINGILRSTDAGETWDTVSPLGGAQPPLLAADGTMIYWNDQNGGLMSSSDSGETWTRIVGGGVLQTRAIELPDGRLAAGVNQTVAVSADGGTQWKSVTQQLPYVPTGLVYSIPQRAFFVWKSSCEATVPTNAVMRSDFDFEQL
jgi:photosystem II stability/assembly factor-like uncharacterized protein